MKYIICTLFMLFINTYVHSQDYHYYYGDKQIPLALNTGYIFVTTHNATTNQELSLIVGDKFTVTKSGLDNTPQIVNKINEKTKKSTGNSKLFKAELKLKNPISVAEYLRLISALKEQRNIDYAAPCFVTERKMKAELSNSFLVKLKVAIDIDTLKALCAERSIEIIGQDRYMPLWHILSCSKLSKGNALEMANELYETGLFEKSEPDFYGKYFSLSQCVNDSLFPMQWGFNNTSQLSPTNSYPGTSGIDVKACDAWQITTGNTSIVTAIIDVGFQVDHPDLAANVSSSSFDAFSGTSPSVIYNPHGTICAGIVGAVQNNLIGVSGIAPTSKIMSVSAKFGVGFAIEDPELALAINWAWHHGADVLSNSWGGPGASALIDEAIDSALTFGRGGLGCVVVCGSGNSNDSVFSPAQDKPDIIAVGGIDRCGFRSGMLDSVPNTCDPWPFCEPCGAGSSFGSQLDVVAPASNIVSTDLRGGADTGNLTGFTSTNPFNGTSAACPMVAGVAALILSVDPCLTQKEVGTIINQTAQKISTYTFSHTSGHPDGTWNNEVGYGLVDAHAAVTLAGTEFLQDTVEQANVIHKYNIIEAGNNVTDLKVMGDYVVDSSKNVILIANKYILLEPGTVIKHGSVFLDSIATPGNNCDIWDTNPIFKMASIGAVSDNNRLSDTLITTHHIKVYPNPTTSNINIDFSVNSTNIVMITLMDLYGRDIYKAQDMKIEGHYTEKINNLGAYSNGIYLLTICLGNYCTTFKILKNGAY